MVPIIHIGYPKTATTWMRNEFYSKLIDYNTIPSQLVYEKLIDFDSAIPEYSEILKYFNSFAGNFIICNHWFIGTNHNFGYKGYFIREHAQRLHQLFPNAQIVLTIRNQPDIIASTYLQYLTTGGTYSTKRFLQTTRFGKLNDVGLFYYPYFEYHQVIELYQRLFGEKNVHIFLYEDFRTNKQAFLKAFCNKLGLTFPNADINFDKINPRYRRGLVHLIRFKNLFTAKNLINKRYIVHIPYFFEYSRRFFKWLNRFSIFGKYASTSGILGKKRMLAIKEYYKNSNQILIDKYGLEGIKKHGYPL